MADHPADDRTTHRGDGPPHGRTGHSADGGTGHGADFLARHARTPAQHEGGGDGEDGECVWVSHGDSLVGGSVGSTWGAGGVVRRMDDGLRKHQRGLRVVVDVNVGTRLNRECGSARQGEDVTSGAAR